MYVSEEVAKKLRPIIPAVGEGTFLDYTPENFGGKIAARGVFLVRRPEADKIEITRHEFHDSGCHIRDEYLLSTTANLTQFGILENDRFYSRRECYAVFTMDHKHTLQKPEPHDRVSYGSIEPPDEYTMEEVIWDFEGTMLEVFALSKGAGIEPGGR